MSESCQTCRFYAMRDGKLVFNEEYECHRFPPVYAGYGADMRFVWPISDPDDWCGEFRPGTYR